MLVNSGAWIWSLLAVPIVVLYLRRIGPRPCSVQTGFLWQRVFAAEGTNSGWLKWRRPVSLFVQLAILLAVVLALCEPSLRTPRHVVLIVDNSASMNATDAKPSRFHEAIKRAREQVASLAYRDQMAIVAAGEPLAGVCGLTEPG